MYVKGIVSLLKALQTVLNTPRVFLFHILYKQMCANIHNLTYISLVQLVQRYNFTIFLGSPPTLRKCAAGNIPR